MVTSLAICVAWLTVVLSVLAAVNVVCTRLVGSMTTSPTPRMAILGLGRTHRLAASTAAPNGMDRISTPFRRAEQVCRPQHTLLFQPQARKILGAFLIQF